MPCEATYIFLLFFILVYRYVYLILYIMRLPIYTTCNNSLGTCYEGKAMKAKQTKAGAKRAAKTSGLIAKGEVSSTCVEGEVLSKDAYPSLCSVYGDVISLNQDDLDTITSELEAGAELDYCAAQLGVAEGEFEACAKRYPRLMASIVLGRTADKNKLLRNMRKEADLGSVAAGKYLLAAKHGLRDKSEQSLAQVTIVGVDFNFDRDNDWQD